MERKGTKRRRRWLERRRRKREASGDQTERGGKGEKKRQRRRLRLDVWRLERDWKYYICVVSSIFVFEALLSLPFYF